MLIKDLINIPESVDKGQFVLKLTEGVNKAQETVENYVVTDQLIDCFRDALISSRAPLSRTRASLPTCMVVLVLVSLTSWQS